MEVCPRCDVPYVYHAEKILKCHYCGKTEKVPGLCPVCKSPHFRFATTGTEKAFDVLKKEFNTSVTLIDSEHADGGKRGGNLGNIIIGTDLALRKIKPFSRFGLTAILNADIHLQRPDFRVYERFFQHAAYVSEFTNEDGGMLIQTFDWKNPFFMHIMNRDYASFFSGEMQKRIDFHYPPVYRMALLTLKKTDLKTHMPPSGKGEYEILGPVPGTSRDSKVEFLLKCRSDRPIQEYVRSAVGMLARRDTSLKIDIDPLVFL
jgi:primosomal protein N' (replication factor Y)